MLQVLTGGRVVSTNTIYMTARQKTLALAVSRLMVPESRLVVYGVLPDGEVLTDSLSVHVRGIRNDGVCIRFSVLAQTSDLGILSSAGPSRWTDWSCDLACWAMARPQLLAM